VQARQKAQDAFLKGNESYTEALTRQNQLMSGWSLPIPKLNSTMFIIIGIVAVILVVVGVIIYRKRSRWDELG
jgi:putative exporter of polyketide antibiotics